jgi:AcrR family transcriptional regulator
VPTGVAMRDARAQLFDAAERILRRDGLQGLTSRAVTTEAGCAKGVLHRHFADFDAFLAEFVLDRIAGIGRQAEALRGTAGTGTVAGNLTEALMELCGSVPMALVGLVIARDDLRARLRQAGAGRLPVAVEATAMVASYLAAEQDLGRVEAGADIDALAPTLVGAIHLLFAGADNAPPATAAVRKVVITVIGGVLAEPPGPS